MYFENTGQKTIGRKSPVFTLFFFSAAPIGTYITNKFDPKGAMVIGACIACIGCLLAAFASSILLIALFFGIIAGKLHIT